MSLKPISVISLTLAKLQNFFWSGIDTKQNLCNRGNESWEINNMSDLQRQLEKLLNLSRMSLSFCLSRIDNPGSFSDTVGFTPALD